MCDDQAGGIAIPPIAGSRHPPDACVSAARPAGPRNALSPITCQRAGGDAAGFTFRFWQEGVRSIVCSLATMNRRLFFEGLQNKKFPPPQYAAHDTAPSTNGSDDGPAPPPYHLEQFRLPVGGRVPQDLFVSVSQLKIHLGLLRVFRELRDRVIHLVVNQDAREKIPSLAQELEPQERWVWFLELALERYAP